MLHVPPSAAPIAGASGRASGGAASAGAFNSRSVGAAALTPPATQHLQQLLLEGVANGTVREGADVGRLVCSTLAAQQQVCSCGCGWRADVSKGIQHDSDQPGQRAQQVLPSREHLKPRVVPVPALPQGVDTMRAASKVALRALMEQKRLVQAAPEQASVLGSHSPVQARVVAALQLSAQRPM